MKLVHFADSHLGFRQFDRDVHGGHDHRILAGQEFGKNQREADVETAFRALVDKTIALRPDLVVIGGDVFHSFRPTNGCIVFALGEFRRLIDGLGGAPIVMAAGNHDLPLSRETSTFMGALRQLGVHVAEWEPEYFDFPALDLSVMAVPDAPGMKRPLYVPGVPVRRYNVLVLHGEVHGVPMVHGDRSGIEIPTEDLMMTEWNYIALGHWHGYQQMTPNCFYSGSVEYTSTNIWGELEYERRMGVSGKGFVERDLRTGAHTFHPLPRVREFLDVRLSANGLTGAELTQLLRDEVWPDNAVVRVTVDDCLKDTQHGVDAKLIRDYKKRAVGFAIHYKRPQVVTVGSRIGTVGRRQTLAQITDEYMRKRFSENLPSDLSLEAITKLSQGYLAQAGKLAGDDEQLEATLAASLEPVAVAS